MLICRSTQCHPPTATIRDAATQDGQHIRTHTPGHSTDLRTYVPSLPQLDTYTHLLLNLYDPVCLALMQFSFLIVLLILKLLAGLLQGLLHLCLQMPLLFDLLCSQLVSCLSQCSITLPRKLFLLGLQLSLELLLQLLYLFLVDTIQSVQRSRGYTVKLQRYLIHCVCEWCTIHPQLQIYSYLSSSS